MEHLVTKSHKNPLMAEIMTNEIFTKVFGHLCMKY